MSPNYSVFVSLSGQLSLLTSVFSLMDFTLITSVLCFAHSVKYSRILTFIRCFFNEGLEEKGCLCDAKYKLLCL